MRWIRRILWPELHVAVPVAPPRVVVTSNWVEIPLAAPGTSWTPDDVRGVVAWIDALPEIRPRSFRV